MCAGFDAAIGDPEGEMKVSPMAYGHMVSALMTLAHGKVAVLMEGGYFIESLAESCAMTLRALLGLPSIRLGQLRGPAYSAVDSILNSLSALRSHWNHLQMQEEYSISSYDAAVDNDCHFPLLSYEGQQHLDAREATKFEALYAKHTDSELEEFASAVRSMRLRNSAALSQAPKGVALAYDRAMARHANMEESMHPERPERIIEIFQRLEEYGLPERTLAVSSRLAAKEEVLLVHDAAYFDSLVELPSLVQKELNERAKEYDSIYLNPATFECALMSCGTLLNVVDAVMDGSSPVNCGAAVIRPPGHHAERDEACGFCIFNNVAVAAAYAIQMHECKRVMILDWDVHHGNGIQNMFYDNPNVLYVSAHRYDNGTFFPTREDANYDFVGEGRGEGFNVNIPWNGSGMGDPEYLSALFSIILPVAYQFDPDLVLVSAGFDAARGDPLGHCKVSPEMYGHIVHHLRNLANGRVIVALEGGYNLNTISLCMSMCVKALLGDPMPPLSLEPPPKPSAVQSIRNVVATHSKYWSSLAFGKKLPNSFEDLKAQMGSIVKKKDRQSYFAVKEVATPTPAGKDVKAAGNLDSLSQALSAVRVRDQEELEGEVKSGGESKEQH